MYTFVTEELAEAMAQERLEAARRARSQTPSRPRRRSPLRSRLARGLVRFGLRLDQDAAGRVTRGGCTSGA